MIENIDDLKAIAGSILMPPYDDDDILTLIGDLYLDITRLHLLEKYTPEQCQSYGIALATVIHRQYQNILGDRSSYRKARKRLPDPATLPKETGYHESQVMEHLVVNEFLDTLKPHLRELLDSKLQGYTGTDFCREHGLARVTGEKRMVRIRQSWERYVSG